MASRLERSAHMSSGYGTGRSATVGIPLDEVATWDDVVEVVEDMCTDLAEHPGEWENASLPRFLDAVTGLALTLDELTSEGGSWSGLPAPALVARLLVAASGYE